MRCKIYTKITEETSKMKLFKKEENNLQSVEQIIDYIKSLEVKIEDLSKELKEVKENNRKSLKKVGISRYNPFSGVGGDQSFSLIILDENNDGAITTSLFTQDGNRVYGKPVKDGKTEHLLSDEEKKLLLKLVENK